MSTRAAMAWCAWMALSAVPDAAVAGSSSDGLVLWHSYRGREEVALSKVLDEYNASRPARQVEALALPYEVLASKLTTAIPRGHGPDLFIFAHERIGGWVDAGLVAPFDGRENGSIFASMLPQTMAAVRYRDEVYGLPLAFKSLALFYNRALVDAPPATASDLLTMGVSLKERGIYALAYPASSFYFHAPWYFGWGAELLARDGESGFSSEGAIRSFEFVHTLAERGLIPQEASGALVTQLFNEGRAAMVMSGPWFVGEVGADINYGVATLPAVLGETRPSRPFLTVEAAFVSAHSRHADDAAALARYLAGVDSATVRAVVGRQAVASRKAWEAEQVRADMVLAAFRDQLDTAIPMSNAPQMRDVWEPGDLALKKLLRGEATPEEAAEAAERRYGAITRPQPAPAAAEPFGLALAVLVMGLLFALGRWCRMVKREGRWSDLRQGWSWVGVGMLVTLILVVVPFAVSVGLAFFSHRSGGWHFVGLGNFWSILSSDSYGFAEPLSFYYALVVTVLWTAVNVAIHVVVGLFLALLLNQQGLRLRPLYRVVLIVPWAVPNYITALIWKGLFHHQFGAINGMLAWLGLDGVAWFSSFGTAFFANVCTNAWLGFPFIMVVCLGALQAIPTELYDAADVDGAGIIQKLRCVTWPLLKPAVVPAILLGIVWTFNQFNIVYLVSAGEPDNSTDILISEVYRWAFTRREQYGYAAAYAVLIFGILLAWSAWSSRIAKRVEESV